MVYLYLIKVYLYLTMVYLYLIMVSLYLIKVDHCWTKPPFFLILLSHSFRKIETKTEIKTGRCESDINKQTFGVGLVLGRCWQGLAHHLADTNYLSGGGFMDDHADNCSLID